MKERYSAPRWVQSHLFGLLPPSVTPSAKLAEPYHRSARPKRPINVLWLSRAKLDSYAQKHDDWSDWRDIRHINNELELVTRLRSALANLCQSSNPACYFEDAQDVPETWALTSPETVRDGIIPIRFATLDPTVHTLETKVHFVGHSTILVSSHAGALGLSLFLPPGDAAVIELQVPRVEGNFHFQHMAKEMGHQYEMVSIERDVDVEHVWRAVEKWVKRSADFG